MGASGVNFILYFSSVDTLCFQAICGLGKISVCETNLFVQSRQDLSRLYEKIVKCRRLKIYSEYKLMSSLSLDCRAKVIV